MTKFSHEHAEWIAPANSYEVDFDSGLRIKDNFFSAWCTRQLEKKEVYN